MTPATLESVAPNPAHTPRKTFRVSDEVYQAAQAKAAERGETLSDVVRRALEEYAKQR